MEQVKCEKCGTALCGDCNKCHKCRSSTSLLVDILTQVTAGLERDEELRKVTHAIETAKPGRDREMCVFLYAPVPADQLTNVKKLVRADQEANPPSPETSLLLAAAGRKVHVRFHPVNVNGKAMTIVDFVGTVGTMEVVLEDIRGVQSRSTGADRDALCLAADLMGAGMRAQGVEMLTESAGNEPFPEGTLDIRLRQ